MPNTDESASSHAHASESPNLKTCPGCGCEFPDGGRGMGKTFHDDKCRKAMHAVHKQEGFPIIALAKAHAATRHAKPGTREAEICRYARTEMTEILRTFLERDDDEGRDVVAYVGTLLDSGVRYVDRQAWQGR